MSVSGALCAKLGCVRTTRLRALSKLPAHHTLRKDLIRPADRGGDPVLELQGFVIFQASNPIDPHMNEGRT